MSAFGLYSDQSYWFDVRHISTFKVSMFTDNVLLSYTKLISKKYDTCVRSYITKQMKEVTDSHIVHSQS